MRTSDVRRFDADAYRSTVRGMEERGESVHDLGANVVRQTGTIHQLVDVRQNRGSHNAMVQAEDGTAVLVNGIALPITNMFDGTGSTSRWLEAFFKACELQYALLAGARTRYNTQSASAVVQDVFDHTPVVQLSQFESDERVAEQVRLLHPDSDGGDSPEDYDLGLAAMLFVEADIWRYGLKGYFTLTADEIGRGFVTPKAVEKYLGKTLDAQGGKIPTDEICRRLFEHWHVFYLQVPSNWDMLDYTISWWQERLGTGRVIPVPNPDILAEVRAGLVYVTEALHPNRQGLEEFLKTGSQSISKANLDKVWKAVQSAEEHFGAQAQLPGYDEIPLPGDNFRHYRDTWPIGHARESENATPETE